MARLNSNRKFDIVWNLTTLGCHMHICLINIEGLSSPFLHHRASHLSQKITGFFFLRRGVMLAAFGPFFSFNQRATFYWWISRCFFFRFFLGQRSGIFQYDFPTALGSYLEAVIVAEAMEHLQPCGCGKDISLDIFLVRELLRNWRNVKDISWQYLTYLRCDGNFQKLL